MSELRKLAVKLMSIGYSLVHTKDYTDIFIDLDEMILCPWSSAGLSLSHLELGLSALMGCYLTAVQNTGLVTISTTKVIGLDCDVCCAFFTRVLIVASVVHVTPLQWNIRGYFRLYSTVPVFEKYLRCVSSCLLVLANR